MTLLFASRLRVGTVQRGVNYCYHLDHLGSIRLVTNNLVAQTFITKYKPYGTPYATSGSERFQYTGKHQDTSTGLYYYGYRYYDSILGRFLTLDEHPPRFKMPQSIDRYSYVLNNPTSYFDSDGQTEAPPGTMGGYGGPQHPVKAAETEAALELETYNPTGYGVGFQVRMPTQAPPGYDLPSGGTWAAGFPTSYTGPGQYGNPAPALGIPPLGPRQQGPAQAMPMPTSWNLTTTVTDSRAQLKSSLLLGVRLTLGLLLPFEMILLKTSFPFLMAFGVVGLVAYGALVAAFIVTLGLTWYLMGSQP